MNDKELLEGHEMYNRQTEKTLQTSDSPQNDKDAESESDKSGGETEGSVYEESDEEEKAKSTKKRKHAHGKAKVEVKTSRSSVKTKTPQRKSKCPVIDVEAILLSGAKNSVTTKTIEAMTPDEKKELVGTAGKSLMLQAKKGMRVQAMTVSQVSNCFISYLLHE
jgi:hypothetical protein